MTLNIGRKQLQFDEISALHVRDLFDGTPARPRRVIAPKRQARRGPVSEPALKPIEPPKHYTEIECPCCKKNVAAPSLDIVIDHYGIPPAQARILEAVWKGKGLPVQTERIFDAMYADDPDGGPSHGAMYSAFKVALCHLRNRLQGSGITIDNVGYRQGYRLVLEGKKK